MGEEEGEKLERERESPEMETPARKQFTDTASKIEESPVFNFINSLSPLKTVNSLRISQRFNSFSFPSVASVFTSPQVSSTKGTEVLKKHHVSDPSKINSLSQKENNLASTQCGLDHLPCGDIQKDILSEGKLKSDISLPQDASVLIDVSKNKEGEEGDWEKLISNTEDFLIFDSPSDTYAFKGTSMCKSLSPQLIFENINKLKNSHYVDPNGVEQSETDPPPQFVDNEPFPNLHRGVRRRCLVYEMGGSRKKQLEESSSSALITLSPYNSISESINRQNNDSACCILPGIGLHLNALAKAPDINGFDHEKESLNNFHSYGGHILVGRDQDYLDQSLERTANAVENCEDINQISPKKKRRKMENDGDNEGCKRCNCKKSKCLKLYCECFAAGVYCVEPCSCQECFNKPIHENIVLAARKQIESRNPLAFAPKVVRISESAPEIGDDSSRTPASARHKRGCNCKKSGCLKKYCECYQEGVGCSINCRCEGCKNAFGRKDGSMPIGAEAHLEEEEIERCEKSVVDRSLLENLFQSSLQQTESIRIPTTPLNLARASVQLPFSSRKSQQSSSLAIGSSSKINGNRNFENTSFLHSQLELEKQIQGSEMPDILQENYSSVVVKSSSPNRKRVSPPHCELGNSPSRMVSRKLILQSIPSFPSLTPK